MRVPNKVIILFLFTVCALINHARALEVPEHPKGRITDFTNTLSPSEISYLDQKLADLEKHTTNQIAVLIIPSLEGDNLEDYSIRLADKWKIGQEGKDNGAILLIVKNDRKLRIEVGYGLEAVLPDGLAGSIIRHRIAPLFRKGQFFNGINQGLDAIIKVTSPTFSPVEPKIKEVLPSPTLYNQWLPLIVLILLLCPLFWVFLGGQKTKSSHTTRGFGYWGGGFSGRGGFSGGGFSGGGGGFGGGGASGGW